MADLAAALSALLERVNSGPLELSLMLTDSNKVKALEADVERLSAALADLQTKYNRVEYLYRCEILISLQIIDYCKAEGIKLPKRLREAPGTFGEVPK